MMIDPIQPKVSRGSLLLKLVVIIAAVFWIYSPVFYGDWLWDDDTDITDNSIIQSPAGLWRIWFVPGSQLDYYPLKASVQWAQWHLWGMQPLGYHLTNIILHLVGALLVWRLLTKFGLKFAWLGGLLFAVQPVNVESVAWIAELKNTLSLPPFLWAMISWIDFCKYGRKRDYVLSLGLFLVAMLGKTTMVMFPLVLLLYAWWKRGKVSGSDLKVAAPFFAVSLALGLLTIWLQEVNAMREVVVTLGGPFSQLALASSSLGFYVFHFFWPVELSPIYAQWVIDPPSVVLFLPGMLFVGLVVGLWTQRHGWGRHALLGVGYFVVSLAPFLGLEKTAYMRFTWVMDHFLYLPMIGLIGLVVAGLGVLDARLVAWQRPCLLGGALAFSGLLAWSSYAYAGMFVNQEVFWKYTIGVNPQSWPAYYNLGNAYLHSNNLGSALMHAGYVAQALEQYEAALRLRPHGAQQQQNIAVALAVAKRMPEAQEHFEEALKLDPHSVTIRDNYGIALSNNGKLVEALEQYRQALEINPRDLDARINGGLILQQLGRIPEAIEQYQEALKINPRSVNAHYNLGNAWLSAGKFPEAIAEYELTSAIDPLNANAHNNLGIALIGMNRLAEAREQLEEALRIDPNYADARSNLERLIQTQRNGTDKK
jgi:tetratricopeptide (TPR) repeat protein